MIFVLDTSKEEVFIGLWEEDWIYRESFEGGRNLNSLIVKKYDVALLHSNGKTSSGIIIAAGPGSFTGLRIGISFANAIAYAQNIPIVAVESTDDPGNLLQKGLDMLKSSGSNFESPAVPSYGAEPHITKPKQ